MTTTHRQWLRVPLQRFCHNKQAAVSVVIPCCLAVTISTASLLGIVVLSTFLCRLLFLENEYLERFESSAAFGYTGEGLELCSLVAPLLRGSLPHCHF